MWNFIGLVRYLLTSSNENRPPEADDFETCRRNYMMRCEAERIARQSRYRSPDADDPEGARAEQAPGANSQQRARMVRAMLVKALARRDRARSGARMKSSRGRPPAPQPPYPRRPSASS